MTSRAKVVKVRSWDELPEVLKPGVYYVDGVKIEIREAVSRKEARMVVSGVKRFAKEYYG